MLPYCPATSFGFLNPRKCLSSTVLKKSCIFKDWTVSDWIVLMKMVIHVASHFIRDVHGSYCFLYPGSTLYTTTESKPGKEATQTHNMARRKTPNCIYHCYYGRDCNPNPSMFVIFLFTIRTYCIASHFQHKLRGNLSEQHITNS